MTPRERAVAGLVATRPKRDAALVVAFSDLTPGERVILHERTCAHAPSEGREPCTCYTITLDWGAKA